MDLNFQLHLSVCGLRDVESKISRLKPMKILHVCIYSTIISNWHLNCFFEGKKNKYFTWITMATIRNNTWCIISHSTHCYLDKIFIFFPCSDSRLQECNYSGPQSKLCKASNLLRWETAIRDSRYSRRGKIRRRRQGGWWEKLASTVQSGVQKNWNTAR